jgi:enhancing lycopene biosynthesis protein 2
MKKVAVVFAGCGVMDGAEIHEAVMTLYAIKKQGAEYVIFAPDIQQYHVVNHLTGQVMNEKRNVLVEAARIARGKIKPLKEFNPGFFDAIIFPGGFGVAKNLCTFAFEGDRCSVNPEVEKAIRSMVDLGKPVGLLCISPVIAARLFRGVELTIGNDPGTASAIGKMGGKHIVTSHGQVVRDKTYNIFSTPCYMLDANIVQIAEGAENIVREMLINHP